MPSSRSSVTAYSFGPRRYANMAANRQLARQAVIQGRRLAPPSLPIDISRATLNRLGMPRVIASPSATEVKSFDGSYTAGNLTHIAGIVGSESGSAFAGICPLNEVRQGAAFYNRVGSKIVARSLSFHADMALSGTGDNLGATLRYMIIYDRQANGAFPTYSTIFANNDAAPNSGTGYAGLNMANRSRFQVLRDRLVTLQMGQKLIQTVNEYIPLNHETEFKADSGTIGDISTGAFYFVAFYVNMSGTSPSIGLSTMLSRLRYYD